MHWPRIYLVLLHFVLSLFADTAFFVLFCFTYWKFVKTLHWTNLSAKCFQQHLFTLCVWVTFWLFLQYFTLFYYLSVISGVWYSYFNCFGVPWIPSIHDGKVHKRVCSASKCSGERKQLSLTLNLKLEMKLNTKGCQRLR